MTTEAMVKWDLSDFYKGIDDPAIKEDMNKLQNEVEQFERELKGKIRAGNFDIKQFVTWMERYQKIVEKSFYIDIYSYLLYSTNTENDKIKEFYSMIEEFQMKIKEKTLFFELELNELNNDKYTKLINAPELRDFKHFLEFNRKKKEHQLTENEEKIILMKNLTGVQAFLKLYDELSSSFTYEIEIEGKKQSLTGAQLLALLNHSNRDIRKKALELFLTKYKEHEMIFTHIYNNVFKDWDLETKKRNFSDPIERRNLENEIDNKVVEVLEAITTESYKLVEKYYNIKKQLLDLPELRIYDIYAPVGDVQKSYSFEEAMDLIMAADEKINPEFKNIVETIYKLKHIDATPRKGKVGGAYCHYGKRMKYPFVFTNFSNNINSVLTLAHELGHAIHFTYIQKTQNVLNFDVSLPVAEIASVFNEMVVFDYLMSQDLKKEEKIALLCQHLEGNFATSHRQNAFYRFEKKMHKLMEQKLPTTQDYLENFSDEIQQMFGNSIPNIKEDYRHFCFVVSHFIHVPFYVYAYNMSNLLVIALYQLYKEQGKDFVPKYVHLLEIGGSMTPAQMLKEVGIDIYNPDFWRKGIKYLEDKVQELKSLVNQ